MINHNTACFTKQVLLFVLLDAMCDAACMQTAAEFADRLYDGSVTAQASCLP
jgi:hypothetical protein